MWDFIHCRVVWPAHNILETRSVFILMWRSGEANLSRWPSHYHRNGSIFQNVMLCSEY